MTTGKTAEWGAGGVEEPVSETSEESKRLKVQRVGEDSAQGRNLGGRGGLAKLKSGQLGTASLLQVREVLIGNNGSI